jgi:hypothetical protein
MADNPEEDTDDAAAAHSAESAGDADMPPAPVSRPDVGATRVALDAVVMEKDHVHVENNLLSDHLMPEVLDPSPAMKSRTSAYSSAQRYFTMISSV